MKKPKTSVSLTLIAVLLVGCAGISSNSSIVCISAGADKKIMLYDFNGATGSLKQKHEIELPGSPGSQFISEYPMTVPGKTQPFVLREAYVSELGRSPC